MKVAKSIRIDDELFAKAKKHCNDNGLIFSAFIERSIMAQLEKEQKKSNRSQCWRTTIAIKRNNHKGCVYILPRIEWFMQLKFLYGFHKFYVW